MSAPSFSEDQYKTDTMNPIKAQAVPSAPPAVKGSYRSVSQGYDNVPDIEIGAGDAVDAHVQRQMRLGFIRKVYGILTCQLALTTIVCSVLALNGACRRFVMTTPSLMYIGMCQRATLPHAIAATHERETQACSARLECSSP